MIKLSDIGSFFEEHVEKIILVIVGLICAWLLITRVILSPNTVSYDNKNYSPSAIDDYVYAEAQNLRQKLNDPPDEIEPYKPKAEEFLAMLDSTINNVDTTLWPTVPYEPGADKAVAGVYNLPRIGEVNDVAVEHIRAVAYLPIDKITPQNSYDQAGNEPNDIDFVTVEAKFDVKQLYDSFNEVFVEYVEQADKDLAEPIFAGVNLQRQQLNSDGTWSDWQDVPRAKIDRYQKLFQNIEDIQDLPPGGLKVQMLQFDNKQVQIDLLQPEAYQFASAKEDWFPPTLHRKFKDLQRKETQEEKRQAREEEKEQQREQDESRRNRRTDTRTGIGGRAGSGFSPGGMGDYGSGGANTRSRDRSSRDRQSTSGYMTDGGRTGDRRRTSRNRSGTTGPMMDMYGGVLGNERLGDGRGGILRIGPTTNDVYYEFNEVALNWLTDFSKLKEPVLFWHHDDTVEPRNKYRYRIRLGVFNPVAGTDKISERDISKKNKVILWSDFSDVTEPVEIPGRSYFFARDIRDIQEAAKTITVTVCKYVLGHWYSEDFEVSKGEAIGDVMEVEIEEDRTQRGRIAGGRITDSRIAGSRIAGSRRGDYNRGDYVGDYPGTPFTSMAMARPEEKKNVPESVDYSTGAIMVDAMPINDWWGDSDRRSRRYYDMLYSFDGINIEHMPVGTTYWSKEMQSMFNRINKLEREPHEEFKAFGSGGRRSARPGLGEYDLMMGDHMMYDGMMMDPGIRR
jgi:hypothetical protein